jgi:hypothetical protein
VQTAVNPAKELERMRERSAEPLPLMDQPDSPDSAEAAEMFSPTVNLEVTDEVRRAALDSGLLDELEETPERFDAPAR